MKAFLIFFSGFMLLLCSGAAQTTTPSPGTKQPDVKQGPAGKPPAGAKTTDSQTKPASSQPTPEMERLLKQLVGRWNTEEKHEASEMLPNGGTGRGQEGIRPGPGRLSLIGEYNSQGPLGEFSGLGIIQWAPTENAYQLYWFDNTAPSSSVLTGRWQGNDLVFTGSDTMNGKRVYARHAFTDLKPDSFTYTIDIGPTATQLKRAVTVRYVKVDMQRMMEERLRGLRPPQKQ